MALTREQVMAALRTVQDPELFKDIVTLNMVKEVRIDGPSVEVTVELTTPACPLKEVIERDVTAALRNAGAEQVKLNITANTRGAANARRDDALPQVKNIIAVGAGKGGVGKSTVAANLAVFDERQAAVARPGPSQAIAFHLQIQGGLSRETVFGRVGQPPGSGGIGGVRHDTGEPYHENGASHHRNSRIVLDRTVT